MFVVVADWLALFLVMSRRRCCCSFLDCNTTRRKRARILKNRMETVDDFLLLLFHLSAVVVY